MPDLIVGQKHDSIRAYKIGENNKFLNYLRYTRGHWLKWNRIARVEIDTFILNAYVLNAADRAFLSKSLRYIDTTKRNLLPPTPKPKTPDTARDWLRAQVRFAVGFGIRNTDALKVGYGNMATERISSGIAISGGLRSLKGIFGFGLRYDGLIVNATTRTDLLDRAALHYFGPEICLVPSRGPVQLFFSAGLGCVYYTESFPSAYVVQTVAYQTQADYSALTVGGHIGAAITAPISRNLAFMIDGTIHLGKVLAGSPKQQATIDLTRFSLTTGFALMLDN